MIIDYVKSVTDRIFAMNNSTESRSEEAAKALLFGQVRFHVVLGDKLSEVEANKVRLSSSASSQGT